MTPMVARVVAFLAFATAFSLAAGAFFGAAGSWALLCLALLALLLHHLRHLHLLRRWLQQPGGTAVPEGGGAWSDVFEVLYRREREGAERERELAQALARF